MVFDYVKFAGHGGPASIGGGAITQADINDLGSKQRQFLTLLGSMTAQQTKLDIMCCNVAMNDTGKAFIINISNITQAQVLAYDDWYAIKGYGKQWIAKPGALAPTFTGQNNGQFKSSPMGKICDFSTNLTFDIW